MAEGAFDKTTAVEAKPTEVGEGLSRDEVRHVKEARRPRAAVVYEIVRTEGEAELIRPVSALWWSGIAAGMSMGFSFLTEAVLAAHLPPSEWGPIIAKLGYAAGFLIVILGRQQLFTENVMTAVLPVISRRRVDWLLRMLRLWTVVLTANVVGCFFFALALTVMPIVEAQVANELAAGVARLMDHTPAGMFSKGILVGWIIASLVWMLAASESMHFLVVGTLAYIIALLGFTHVVAGSVVALYGLINGLCTLQQAVGVFFLPNLAGNIVGGTLLFALLSYAQVSEEVSATRRADS